MVRVQRSPRYPGALAAAVSERRTKNEATPRRIIKPPMYRLIAASVLLTMTVQAQSPIQPFLAELNRALESGDRAAVAALVEYPVTVSIGGVRVPFQSPAALLERFDDVFTPEVRAAVTAGASTETKDGFLVAASVVAVTRRGAHLKITSIVVPPPDTQTTAATPATDAANSRAPRRIGVRAGPRPTQFAGLLVAGATDSYVVFVQKGQLLDVRLERGRNEAVLRVVNAATGAPLGARAQGAPVVTGRVEASAEYRIDVQRTSSDDAPLRYMLTVSIR